MNILEDYQVERERDLQFVRLWFREGLLSAGMGLLGVWMQVIFLKEYLIIKTNTNFYLFYKIIASALDYARSMRILTDTLHKTTIASFYQASEAIYSLFDRVMVLDKGIHQLLKNYKLISFNLLIFRSCDIFWTHTRSKTIF